MRIFGLPIGAVRQACLLADDGDEGYTDCRLMTVGESSICLMSGTYCTVIDAGGGSGGGGTGGIGGGCTIDQAALCPPSCGACNRV